VCLVGRSSADYIALGNEPVHFVINEGEGTEPTPALQKELFGEKSVEWFKRTLGVLDRVRVIPRPTQKPNMLVQAKLKLLSILLNILIYRLMKLYPVETQEFVEKLVSSELQPLSGVCYCTPLSRSDYSFQQC